jgi:glycosyltransferase involved in cell wall biosynthesis
MRRLVLSGKLLSDVMKILLVQDSDWLERGPHQQQHLMERLTLKGHTVRVIDHEIAWATKPRGNFCSRRKVSNRVCRVIKGPGVRVVRPGILKFPLLDYFSMIFTHEVEIRRQIVEFKPDIMVGMGILNTFIAILIAKQHKIPFMYYVIDAWHTLIPFKRLRFLGRVLESYTLKRSDVICVINEELKRYAIQLGAQPSKVHVIRAGIDKNHFKPDMDGSATRQKLGIGKKDVVLFFMGWLYSFSGLKEVAKELVESRQAYPEVKLLIVGEGDLYNELRRISQGCSSKQIILVGRQPYESIPQYIAAADICLLPAYNNETMRSIVPIKLYEYMACGKPVISTRLQGVVKEFDDDNGVLYVDEPTDVLKRAIELCNDGESLGEHATKAKKFVEKYSWDEISDGFESILNSMMKDTNQASACVAPRAQERRARSDSYHN